MKQRSCRNRLASIVRLAPLLAFFLVSAPAAATADARATAESRAERAVVLYDEGRYAEARPLLQELNEEGAATGPLLYRLAFCAGFSGEREAQHQIMERALASLRHESEVSDNLEVSFFLANAQQVLGHHNEARTTAARATDKIESSAWGKLETPLERFRAGKLYADQNRVQEASKWYGEAIEGFSKSATGPAYVLWARRYLAREAWLRSDYAAAETQYEALAALDGVSTDDLDHLGMARVRLGRYEAAVEAWRSQERLDPANADRARYCWRLARAAAAIGLPETDASGRRWADLSKEDLEAAMAEQTAEARTVREEATKISTGAPGERLEGEATDPEFRKALAERLAKSHRLFVAAALEYAIRGFPIRETAFFGGYAPLIFHDSNWDLPESP